MTFKGIKTIYCNTIFLKCTSDWGTQINKSFHCNSTIEKNLATHYQLMGEEFMGGCPLQNFLISDFILPNTNNIFCQCYQNYLRHQWLFHFSDEWKMVSVAQVLRWFFQTYWPLCMDLKLDMDRFELWKKFWGISDIYDVINVGFLCHFTVFGYSKCRRVCRNSWYAHRICVWIGSTTLQSLMCNRLCVI